MMIIHSHASAFDIIFKTKSCTHGVDQRRVYAGYTAQCRSGVPLRIRIDSADAQLIGVTVSSSSAKSGRSELCDATQVQHPWH